MKTLYENIKTKCKEKRITVFELEEAAGLKFNTVTRWGKTSPSIDKVAKVADALNITIDELMKGEA